MNDVYITSSRLYFLFFDVVLFYLCYRLSHRYFRSGVSSLPTVNKGLVVFLLGSVSFFGFDLGVGEGIIAASRVSYWVSSIRTFFLLLVLELQVCTLLAAAFFCGEPLPFPLPLLLGINLVGVINWFAFSLSFFWCKIYSANTMREEQNLEQPTIRNKQRLSWFFLQHHTFKINPGIVILGEAEQE